MDLAQRSTEYAKTGVQEEEGAKRENDKRYKAETVTFVSKMPTNSA